jgi:aminopeptidase YwaD
VMFRIASLLAAVWLVPSPVQSAPQDSEAAVRRRVEQALAGELARLRESILDTIRQELGRATRPPDPAFDLVTEDLLRKHATYLASDELEGRQAGYEGNEKAAAYIASAMKKAGLKPVGDKDDKGNPTHFQEFKVGSLVTRNCLGMLEGRDPELKNEIIVLGAHFDHLGTADNEGPPFQRSDRPRDDDKIWNGADDNGSGTTTLLGLVKAFGEGGLQPKRSILFIAFSGEEGGLVGSYHYVAHPVAPIARHVFMLNLDMVGRNPDKAMKIDGVGSAEGPALRRVVEEAVAATGLKATVNDKVTVMGGDSDHTPFRRKGVPFIFFFSGFHADYHKVTDHAEKLAYGNMVKVAKTAGRILMTLADSDEAPAARKLEFGPPAPARPRRTLGIGVEEIGAEERESLGLKEGESGVRVTAVNPGSVALAAGVEKDDIIIRLDGKTLSAGSEFSELPKILNAIAPGQDVDVVVIRNGKRSTLRARWEK